MKNTKLDYINILFAVILGVLVVVNSTVRNKNKEQYKIPWKAEIQGFSEDSLSENQNIIKIVDALFFNNFNHSLSGIDSDSEMIISNKKRNTIYLKNWDKQLLPDSLSLKYYSVDERNFYLLSTRLPYEKIRNLVKKNNKLPNLILKIQPKGKVILKMSQVENENKESEFVASFIAKKVEGELDMLVYKKSLSGKYNDYEGISNVIDFSDLLQNQYNWSVKLVMKEQNELIEIYANSFADNIIEISKNNDIARVRNIPRTINIKWGNQQEYGIHYSFDPNEILNAFRKLNETKSSEPIIFILKLNEGKLTQCEISKGEIAVPLKDLYPELPIKYAN